MPMPEYQPTPEQLALSEERKRKRQRQSELPKPPSNEEKGRILSRDWVQLEPVNDAGNSTTVKFMTWNLLAQCLVRRDLFPTSNCLKAGQREHMIYREILSHGADIMCLQEVDRLEKLEPVLDEAGYSYIYAAGPKKLHGCLIAYQKDAYEKVDDRLIQYDEQEVRLDGHEQARRGSSFRTRNIASLVALRIIGAEDAGFIVSTTHLFWHPRYTYERARQAGIMMREVVKFREDSGHKKWPCILAGDFNFPPMDAAYSLLVGDCLSPEQEESLAKSRVVHHSIDPTIQIEARNIEADEDGSSAEKDPDKIITNARPASPTDGLLSTSELVKLFSIDAPLRSAYDEGQRKHRESGADVATFGDRMGWGPTKLGAHEPEWTSYTHYWKTVLGMSSQVYLHGRDVINKSCPGQDYLFILDLPDCPSVVTGFSTPHRTEHLKPGLPQMGICGSDHVSLCAQVLWHK